MNIFSLALKIANENIKLRMKYKGSLEEAKEISKKKAENKEPSVSNDVSKDEFKKRYNGILTVLYVNILFLLFFFYQLFTSSTILFGMFSICSILIASIIYFKTSFTAWRARYIYNTWEKRSEPMPFYFSDFINEIELNWKELLPLEINNNKRGKKNV